MEDKEYYFKHGNLILFAGVSLICAGIALAMMIGAAGGLQVSIGIFMIAIGVLHKSKPILALHKGHLEYRPAPLVAKILTRYNEISAVEKEPKKEKWIEVTPQGGKPFKLFRASFRKQDWVEVEKFLYELGEEPDSTSTMTSAA